jgi:hypothetical protein
MNGNDANAVADGSAIPASSFVADLTPPFLKSFELNMNFGSLTVKFSETVPPAAVLPTSFVLQSAADGTDLSTSSRALTGGNVSTAIISDSITIALTTADLDAIKALPALAVGFNSAYLSMAATAVTDVSGNNVTAIPSNAGEVAKTFVFDTTRPSLVSFSLDMDASTMSMVFSETVDSSTFNSTSDSAVGCRWLEPSNELTHLDRRHWRHCCAVDNGIV